MGVQHPVGAKRGNSDGKKTLLVGLLKRNNRHANRLFSTDIGHLKGGMHGRGINAFQVDESGQIARLLKDMPVRIQQFEKFSRDIETFNISSLGLRGDISNQQATRFLQLMIELGRNLVGEQSPEGQI